VIVLAVRPLLPPGSLVASPGLPAAIAVRAIVAAAFFSVEVYLPFLLTADYGLAPWLAGLILTVGAVSWAIGSHVQGTLTTSHAVIIRLGAACMSVGIAVQFITALFLLSPVVAAAGWLVAGFGMGLVYPRARPFGATQRRLQFRGTVDRRLNRCRHFNRCWRPHLHCLWRDKRDGFCRCSRIFDPDFFACSARRSPSA
jgi:hypothetical protein